MVSEVTHTARGGEEPKKQLGVGIKGSVVLYQRAMTQSGRRRTIARVASERFPGSRGIAVGFQLSDGLKDLGGGGLGNEQAVEDGRQSR